jgi:hypothetical protein
MDNISGHKITNLPGNAKFLISFGGFGEIDYQDQLKLIDLETQTVKKLKKYESLDDHMIIDKRVSRLDSLIINEVYKLINLIELSYSAS